MDTSIEVEPTAVLVPELSYAQELFCAEYVRTGNSKEAYRNAFGRYNREDHDRLLSDNQITDKIFHIRKVVSETINFTIVDHLMNLAMIRDTALRRGDLRTALASEKSRGEAMGFYKGKVSSDQQVHITVDTLPPLLEYAEISDGAHVNGTH